VRPFAWNQAPGYLQSIEVKTDGNVAKTEPRQMARVRRLSSKWLTGAGTETPLSGISWSHAGYHLDRLAFYTIADTSRLYFADPMVKVSPDQGHFHFPFFICQ